MFAKQVSNRASDANTPALPRLVPWVEKFRPRNVNEISSQEHIISSLRNASKTGDIPHMLFYGPPGTGKTSTILALARDLFGPELMKSRVLELNASDERGIQVVREKIKNFAMSTVRQVPGVPGYKLVILDEADSLTSDAQAALRRTMETYSKITRFCIICNYVSRIIDPVASRCSKYRFKPLDEESMLSRLKYVCESENTKADEQCLRTVLLLSQGDMRKAITLLQSASQLFGGVITSDNVVSVSGEVPADVIETFYNSIVSNTASVDSVRRASSSLLLSGYSLTTIYDKMLDLLIKDNNISDNVKALVSEKIATSEKKLVDGASEELQLYDVAASLLRMNRNILVPSDLRKSYV